MRLGTFAFAAPSHALVKLIHLSIRARYPISRPRSVPDVLAGPILASEVGGPKCKIWGAIGSDLLAGGAGGARLAAPRLTEVQLDVFGRALPGGQALLRRRVS